MCETMNLDEVAELWEAYRDFDPRYTPRSIQQDYERRLLSVVPWLLELTRKQEDSPQTCEIFLSRENLIEVLE
jgi:hypothetical protein